jgi:hypothetical protein
MLVKNPGPHVVHVIPRQLRPETDEKVYLNGQQSTHFSFDRNFEVRILCRFKARKRQSKRALSNGTCFSCKLAVVSSSSLAMYVSEHTPWVIGLAKFFLEMGVLSVSASIDAHNHFIKTKYSV